MHSVKVVNFIYMSWIKNEKYLILWLDNEYLQQYNYEWSESVKKLKIA